MTVIPEKSYCNDDVILKTFFPGKGKLTRKWKSIIESHENIKDYLLNRFPDSSCLKESLYRIKYKLELRPTCKICGNPVLFKENGFYGNSKFSNCCCKQCQNINRNINKTKAFIEKFGVDNPFRLDRVKESIREHVNEHYGGFTMQSKILREKAEETNLKRYGCKNVFGSKDIQNKIKKTIKRHYGVENPFDDPKIQQKCANSAFHNKARGTGQENAIYEKLIHLYGKDDVLRQYKCIRYPWRCDFYIKSKDLFIEYQGYFTHQDHAFDANNDSDIAILNDWKRRKEKIFKNAIKTWTASDVNKRETAKKNHLNYLEFFNMNEFNRWYDMECGKSTLQEE